MLIRFCSSTSGTYPRRAASHPDDDEYVANLFGSGDSVVEVYSKLFSHHQFEIYHLEDQRTTILDP